MRSKVEKAELTPWGMVTLDPLGTWVSENASSIPLAVEIAFSSTNAMLTLPAKEMHRVNDRFPVTIICGQQFRTRES